MILQIMSPPAIDIVRGEEIAAACIYQNHCGTKTIEVRLKGNTDIVARIEDPVFFFIDKSGPELKVRVAKTLIAIRKMLHDFSPDLYLCSHATYVESQEYALQMIKNDE